LNICIRNAMDGVFITQHKYTTSKTYKKAYNYLDFNLISIPESRD